MTKEGYTRSYQWLLHIAIWAVLFGMPFFSPRPGQPLHGSTNYIRFIPTLISFLVVFYVNYFILIKKYLYNRKLGLFILWNILLIAVASLLVHLSYRYVYPMSPIPPGQSVTTVPHGPRPIGGPGHRGPAGPGRTINFIIRNSFIYFGIICVAIAIKMTE
jgi:hypothetical protein